MRASQRGTPIPKAEVHHSTLPCVERDVADVHEQTHGARSREGTVLNRVLIGCVGADRVKSCRNSRFSVARVVAENQDAISDPGSASFQNRQYCRKYEDVES